MSSYAQIPTDLICRFGELSKTEIRVLCFLYASRNRKSGRCNPSFGAIGRAVGVAKSHIGDAVKTLDSFGWICVMPDGNFLLLDKPDRVTKSVTPKVTKSVTEGLPNRELKVTESVTKGYGNGNPHIKESLEQKNEQKNEQNKTVAIATRSDASILMAHHAQRIGTITDGGAQGKCIQSLLKNFCLADCLACYNYQVSELRDNGGWRSSVNWGSVLKFIPEWILSGRPLEVKNGTHRNNDRAERATDKHNLRNELKARVESRHLSGNGVAGGD